MRLIDADDLSRQIQREANPYGKPTIDFETAIKIMEWIDKKAAVDAAPVRRGYWIEESSLQICSECGEEHEWDDYRAPYCDTCGAKMDAEETDDDRT